MAQDDEHAELKAILREAFGDSSSDSNSDGDSLDDLRRIGDSMATHHSIFGDTHIWEPVSQVNGLWVCRDFLSADQQSALLSALEKEGYLAQDAHNQAMKFGDLPPWALELSYNIREDVPLSSCFPESNRREAIVFPPDLLLREPLFNQIIVNIYQPGEGICAHVDLMRFEDGIAIVSLESSCVMHFSSIKEGEGGKIPVLLNPGSVVLMWGDARYEWKHEINRKPGFQNWGGKEIEQKRRISVTLRRLRSVEC